MYVGTATPSRNHEETGVRLAFGAIEHLDEYRAENLRNWESRVPVHAASRDYDLAGLAADPDAAEPGRRVRPAVARRPHRARRRAPPVPHRHRHGLAGAPRRRGSPASTSRRARWRWPVISRPRLRHRRALRRVGALRGARGARRRLRPRVHGRGRAQLAARHRGLGAGGGRAAPAGRAPLRPRRAPDAHDHRSTTGTDDAALGSLVPYFEADACYWSARADLHRRPAGGVARAVRVEPRAGRDRAGSDRRRDSQ